MVYTWAANIRPLLEAECYHAYYKNAPQFRREKADQLKVMQAKAQSIGVWALYEQMKAAYGVGSDAVFNLSHSGEYVLCSIYVGVEPGKEALVRVGCDVEKVQNCRLKVAKRFFCESEYAVIAAECDEKKQQELFYRYWVLKESFMKATRQGMALALDAFEICLGNPPLLIDQPQEYAEPFYFMESELGEGAYRVAVCSTDAQIDSVVKEIKLGL